MGKTSAVLTAIAALTFCANDAKAASPAPWRQADFAADLYRSAVAGVAADENVVLSPWGVAPYFAERMADARDDAARGMAFALQIGGVEPPTPNETAATFREARLALSRAARTDAAVEESGTNCSFRFSAKWDPAAAEILVTPPCSALRLPCVGGTFEMLAITPSSSNTLAEVEAMLGRAFLDRLATAPRTTPEAPSHPRFDLQSHIDLNPVLSPMGMAAFFAGNAAGQSISIAANEEWIEAFVATGPSLEPLPPVPPLPPDAASTPIAPPFLFIIRETRTGLILFLGRVTTP